MQYFLLRYRTVENFVEKRAPYRATHLQLAQEAQANGTLLLGGALDAPADEALLLFRGPTDQFAREFAEQDPYVQAGLISQWEVRPWQIVIGTLHPKEEI